MASSKAKGSPKTQHHRGPEFERLAKSLGTRLRRLRKRRGWTIEAAAERYQVEPAQVRRLETATSNPTLATLFTISRALGTTLGHLLRER